MQQSKKRVCQNECLLTSADAVMAVAILAVSSDGKLAKREMDGLKVILASNPLGYIASSVAEKGCDVILDMVTDLLTPSLRETAYAWAVYMVAADRKLVSPEHKFLEKLRKKLGIHVALVGKIKAVVPMLNRVK